MGYSLQYYCILSKLNSLLLNSTTALGAVPGIHKLLCMTQKPFNSVSISWTISIKYLSRPICCHSYRFSNPARIIPYLGVCSFVQVCNWITTEFCICQNSSPQLVNTWTPVLKTMTRFAVLNQNSSKLIPIIIFPLAYVYFNW